MVRLIATLLLFLLASPALALLRQHPQYADVIAKRLDAVAFEDRDCYLFIVAARWADDVRDNRAYHRGPCHYVNYPVVPPGETVTPPEPPAANILSALK